MEINKTLNMDCIEGFNQLEDKSINLIFTSPPYAEQRKHQYGGVSEKDYPEWTVKWCEAARDKLTDDGSICINIRPHLKNGCISEYVLKTRLALRQVGWIECEELIWIKPDSPPLGSIERPRRAWESILWFSKTGKPKCYPKANGTESNRLGFEANKFEEGGLSHIHAGQNKSKSGIARCKDYIEVGTGKIEKGYKHPAMFSPELPEYIIKMMTDENDVVCDPFIGSGTTARVSRKLNRQWIGFEINKEFCNMSNSPV